MSLRRVSAALVVSLGVVVSACGVEPLEATPQPVVSADDEDGGEERSVDSAVDAAVRFVCSGQRLLDTPPSELRDAVRSMWSAASADGAFDATLDRLSALRDRLGAGVGPTRFRQAVLAVRVDAASAARVVVSIWWVGVLSRSGVVTPQAQWSTTTVTMVSEQGGWKVAAEASEAGPVPDHSVDAEPITHAEMERRLAGFVDREAR